MPNKLKVLDMPKLKAKAKKEIMSCPNPSLLRKG